MLQKILLLKIKFIPHLNQYLTQLQTTFQFNLQTKQSIHSINRALKQTQPIIINLEQMLKSTITQYFDNYQANKIKDIPFIQYKPKRHPFEYLYPQTIVYKDLRQKLLPKPTQIDKQQESVILKIKRYYKEFTWRNSAKSRVMTHALQYTVLYGLVVFGFYSRQFSGWKRAFHVLKQTTKTGILSASLYTLDQAVYPFFYKFAAQIDQKPTFSIPNIISTILFIPITFLFEWNALVAIRKTLFMTMYLQVRQLQYQNNRWYLLYPEHLWSIAYKQSIRIKHPFEDSRQKLPTRNTRAYQQRKEQQKQDIKRQILAQNKGQRIPSQNMFLILPQIYRQPTDQQKLQHELKASKKTQQMLDQRGIKFIRMDNQQQHIQKVQKSKKRLKELKWYWPFS